MKMKIIETERLTLRLWQVEDTPLLAQINQDPQVMEFFPSLQTFEETEAFVERVSLQFKSKGYTLYAVEIKARGIFIGFVGLNAVGFTSHFTPATEIAWRLAQKFWGMGYATEAAKAVLDHAFNDLSLDEIVSITVPKNTRSRRVMEKIGFVYDPSEDFLHPNVDVDSPLCAHVLYRLDKLSYYNYVFFREK